MKSLWSGIRRKLSLLRKVQFVSGENAFLAGGGNVAGRESVRGFDTFFERAQLEAYQHGTMSYRYKDLLCIKNPLDIALYLRLLWKTKPKTVFEIGTKEGGSALFFRDMARVFELGAHIVSIDINPPAGLAIDGLSFVKGDVYNLSAVFDSEGLHARPRPWLVVEDSAHTYGGCLATLEFCSRYLIKDEYLVIEDGVLADLGWSERYDGGPNRAIATFFEKSPYVFEIDTSYCDMFGRNATYNPNGYLRKL